MKTGRQLSEGEAGMLPMEWLALPPHPPAPLPPRAHASWLLRRLSNLLFYAAMPALSLLNAGVGLLLPMLLEPVAFGQYALVVTLFQYALVFDFGLSQLTDRHVPKMLTGPVQSAALLAFRQGVLWTRLYIAAFLLIGGGMAAVLLQAHAPGFPSGPAWLSLAAGVYFMVVLGPASFYRASSDRLAFGRINILVMLILALARPAGLILGGITGCFALLGLAYAALAAQVQAGMPLLWAARPGLVASARLVRQGLPLFLTSFVWAFYMTANRWVVSSLASGVDTGHFAFGSNVVTLVIGAVGALSQYYYPAMVTRCAAEGPFAVSSALRRDFMLLALAMAVPTVMGILVGPTLVGWLYPKFLSSIPVMKWFLLAVPSLVVASWLMPLGLSVGGSPWRESLVYPVALVILLAVTRLGFGVSGITGAALGLVASAMPLLVLQLWTLHRASLLRRADASAIFAMTAAVTAAASLLLL